MLIASDQHSSQLPGSGKIPDRIPRGIDRSVIDHRRPVVAGFDRELQVSLEPIFKIDEHEI
jgi:hypothetical protein